ncbi:hypothetical protein IT399_03080 [Candidatus Nomurabacteria bacterium]|nr:hypothetical protein [Candidatus Nomurabacteria bacterium]
MKNLAEKIRNTHTSEEENTSESPTEEINIDDEQKFEQHREKTLSDIKSRVSQIKEDQVIKLDRISRSYELPEDDIATIRQESQVDVKLKSNSDDIDNLTQDVIKQIKRVGVIEQIEPAKEVKEEVEKVEENKNERYREKITNPEALKAIDHNSELFHEQNSIFLAKIESYKTKENISKDDFFQLTVESQRLAGILMYGSRRGDKRLEHFENADVINKEAEDSGQKAYDEFKSRGFNDKEAEEAREHQSKTVRDNYLPSQEASLYAIGVKEADIDMFLKTQSKLKDLAEKSGNKVDGWLTKNDFEVSRYRAYFEARRTARNIFTHVTSGERAREILLQKALKSSNKFTEKNVSTNEANARGQTGNVEENIYFTSGGGGYQYGGKIENGGAVPRKIEDFAFFATTGGDIMASGKSIEVLSPSLREQHESLRGKAVGDFESTDGTELPLSNMYLVVPFSQLVEYTLLLEENPEFASHIIGIDDEIVEKALREGNGYIKRDSPAIQSFVDNELKKQLIKESENKDKIFATIAGRKSTDWDNLGNIVSKWQQIN